MKNNRSKSFIRFGLILAAVLLVAGCRGAAPTAPAVQPVRQLNFDFVSHVTAQMPEQDVYVVKSSEDKELHRLDPAEAEDFLNALAFAAADPVAHDPFVLGPNAVGPYPKGAELGFTIGDWLAGSGSGTYIIKGDEAELRAAFENLVPYGVYTMWCATINLPPNFSITDKPCGAEDGSENTFIADAEGNADFNLTMSPIPDSTPEILRVFAIAYHSDGQTYGPLPGDFGLNSHVQLFFGLPTPDSEAWQIIDGNEVAGVQ
jgi:hypothetical protein